MKRKFLAVSALIWVPAVSWSQPFQDAPSHAAVQAQRPIDDTAFYRPDVPPAEFELASSPGYQRALDSTAQVLFPGSGQCSGTFVSTKGHLLTAMHCLYSCLIQSGAAQEVPQNPPIEGVTVYEVKSENLKGASCLGGFEVKKGELSWGQNRIVAAGKGWVDVSPDAKLGPQDFLRVLDLQVNQGFGSEEDFVLIQASRIPARASCMPLSAREPLPSMTVYALGYPAETFRGDGFDSPGLEKQLSFGKVTTGIQDDVCMKERMDSIQDPEQRSAYLQVMNPENIFWSDMDAVPGSSGSALINSKGSLVGVLVEIQPGTKNPSSQFCSGWTRAVRLSKIRKTLVRDLSPEEAEAAFDCPLLPTASHQK